MTLPAPITDGIFPDVEDAEYREAPGVSQTSLKEMARSPGHYAEAISNPDQPTEFMVESSICHQLLLEPARPWWWAIRPPGLDGRTKEGKAWAASCAGKEIIGHSDWLYIEGAVHAARNHPTIRLALEDSPKELSIFRWFRLGGQVLRKGRIDLAPPGPALCDFKFVQDAREAEFAKQVFTLKYYLQAAYYLDLYNDNLPAGEEEKSVFIFFAVEKAPPFGIGAYALDDSAIKKGRGEYVELLTRYMECEEKGEWSVYHERSPYSLKVKTLALPAWATKREPSIF